MSWQVLTFGAASIRMDIRVMKTCALLCALLLVSVCFSLSVGDFPLSAADVAQTLLGLGSSTQDVVLFQLRLPRVIIAMLVGVALSVSGAMLQGITRNELADPSIIGINHGAAVVAVALMVWIDTISVSWLPFGAFVGGMTAAIGIYLIAWKKGSAPLRMVLVGIGVAAFAGALTTIMIIFSDIDQVGQAYIWLSGSVYGRGWGSVMSLSMWVLVLLPLTCLLSPLMNALLQGDDTVRAIGVDIERARLVLLFIAVALASASVAAAGIFSFLGLVSPHIARRLVGPLYQGVIPVAALVGACLVVTADVIGRSVVAPYQIPAGLVTAMIGAPYFFWCMKRQYLRGRS